MNKTGEINYGQPPVKTGAVHPILILGIIVFVLPFLGNVIKLKLPLWLNGVGLALILLGAAITIFKK